MSRSATPTQPAAPAATMKNRLAFIREFIKAPGVIAAVAPSSRHLGAAMIRGLDLAGCRTIVEFGPGSGTFTRAVLGALPIGWSAVEGGKGRFIAIEYNAAMAEILREQLPQVKLYTDDAANIVEICRKEGIGEGEVDAVVSGLGWPSFPDAARTRMLEATHRALRPGGEFRTFGYHCGLLMRGAWHFRAEVRRLFREVTISRVVWRNTPPAFVYRCVK